MLIFYSYIILVFKRKSNTPTKAPFIVYLKHTRSHDSCISQAISIGFINELGLFTLELFLVSPVANAALSNCDYSSFFLRIPPKNR